MITVAGGQDGVVTGGGGGQGVLAIVIGAGEPVGWELGGRSLLQRAVTALLGSGRVGRVVVLAGAAGADALVGEPRAVLVSADELAALLGTVVDDAPVVVHDTVHPLVSARLVAQVVDALTADGGAAGAVAVRSVTDTLKWVDDRDVITGTADREGYRVICSPQAHRAAALRAVLAAPGAGGPAADLIGSLPALLGRPDAPGGAARLVTVAAPEEVFRVVDRGDLELAAALLAEAGRETEPQGSR